MCCACIPSMLIVRSFRQVARKTLTSTIRPAFDGTCGNERAYYHDLKAIFAYQDSGRVDGQSRICGICASELRYTTNSKWGDVGLKTGFVVATFYILTSNFADTGRSWLASSRSLWNPCQFQHSYERKIEKRANDITLISDIPEPSQHFDYQVGEHNHDGLKASGIGQASGIHKSWMNIEERVHRSPGTTKLGPGRCGDEIKGMTEI
ncbi:hypothetical protein B0H11DRAFT_1914327 [Mycena galericulata]|nr:hypothetical protein B0H11DRAFT_1914327 [Mycena galericulata]